MRPSNAKKTKKVSTKIVKNGQCCGSVDRTVASDTRGPRFESSHRQILYYLFTGSCIEKTKIKEKEAGIGPIFFKKNEKKFNR